MAPRISIRIETSEIEMMLSEINYKPATAVQSVLEIFTYLKRSTLLEIRGLFSPIEITALAMYAKTKKPSWASMCSALVYANDIEEAEKYRSSISSVGANPNAVIDKIKKMTSAQVAVFQIEIYSFWEHQRRLREHSDPSSPEIAASDIITARKNPDLKPLINILS